MIVERLERRALLANFGLDTTFGDHGYAPVIANMLLQSLPDGKILTAAGELGSVTNHASLTKLNPDGSVDTSFEDASSPSDLMFDSFVAVDGDRVYISGMLQPSGGLASDRRVFVRAIHLSDGSADTSFGDGGILSFVPRPFTTPNQYSVQYDAMTVTHDGGVLL